MLKFNYKFLKYITIRHRVYCVTLWVVFLEGDMKVIKGKIKVYLSSDIMKSDN